MLASGTRRVKLGANSYELTRLETDYSLILDNFEKNLVRGRQRIFPGIFFRRRGF
jgi:hypothetical protein